jgi:hypothetical protein
VTRAPLSKFNLGLKRVFFRENGVLWVLDLLNFTKLEVPHSAMESRSWLMEASIILREVASAGPVGGAANSLDI